MIVYTAGEWHNLRSNQNNISLITSGLSELMKFLIAYRKLKRREICDYI